MDQNRLHKSLLVLLTLFTLGLRLCGLGWQPLWWDEGYSLYAAGMPIGKMILETAEDIHPPLYYALLHLWGALVGMWPTSVRLFSVFVGVITILVLFQLVRRWGGWELAWATGLLATINPFLVYYSQEVRMYALTALSGLVSTYFMLLWLESLDEPNVRETRLYSVGYLAATAAALYTHYYTLFIPIAQTVFVYVVYRPRSLLRKWLMCQMFLLALYLPWIVFTLSKLTSYVSGKVSVEKSNPLGVIDFLRHHVTAFSLGHLPIAWTWLSWSALLFLLLVAAGALRAGHLLKRPFWAAFPPILLAISLLGAFIINLVYPFNPFGFERLLLFAAPAYCFLLAMGCVALWQAKRAMAVWAAVLVLAANALALWAFYTTPRYVEDDYRPLVARMRTFARPKDAVMALYPWQIGYLHAYYQDNSLQQEPAFKQDWPARFSDPSMLSGYLDGLMARYKRLWFPAHQTGGRILEEELAAYLSENYHTALAEWPNPHTRLYLFSVGQELRRVDNPINFGNRVRLAGYGLDSGPVTADGGIVAVELDWQLLAEMTEPYYVGLRLTDSANYTWAQRSAEPVGGSKPFGEWVIGELVRDRHGLLVPADIPPGQYTVKAGLYRRSDNMGLDVLNPVGIPQGVETALGQVTIILPEEPPAIDRLEIPHPQLVDFVNDEGEMLRLLGYGLSGLQYQPGNELHVVLFWQPLTEIRKDTLVELRLVSGSGVVSATESRPPLLGQYPMNAWRRGYPVRDPQSILLPPTLAPGKYTLQVGLLQPTGGQAFIIRNSDRPFVNLAEIEVIAGRPHTMTPWPVPIELKATWGQSIRLLGYEPFPTRVAPGDRLTLTVYWQALSAMQESYTVFVHLLDENQLIHGQIDSVPGRGTLPTTSWIPGEYLQDTYSFPVKADAREGTYRLEIGIYHSQTGQRLPVRIEGQAEVQDHLLLPEEISVMRR